METSASPYQQFGRDTPKDEELYNDGYIFLCNSHFPDDTTLLRQSGENMDSYLKRLGNVLQSATSKSTEYRMKLGRLIQDIQEENSKGFEVELVYPAYYNDGRILPGNASFFAKIPDQATGNMQPGDITQWYSFKQNNGQPLSLTEPVKALVRKSYSEIFGTQIEV